MADVGKSQNGWPASPNPAAIGVSTVSVPLARGVKTLQLAAGAAPALVEMIQWWDANIEPVETVYGYNYREIRGYEGSGTISNHGSGTAIDINAAKHPLGASGTVPLAAAARIVAKATSLGLRWGGSYRGRKDEMHFEAMFSPGVTALAKSAVTAAKTGATPGLWAAAFGIMAVGGFWLYQRSGRRPSPSPLTNRRRNGRKAR